MSPLHAQTNSDDTSFLSRSDIEIGKYTMEDYSRRGMATHAQVHDARESFQRNNRRGCEACFVDAFDVWAYV